MSELKVREITLNQIGYTTAGNKRFRYTGTGRVFRVLDKETGATVYSGEFGPAVSDKPSGVNVHTGDFSAFTAAGNYVIETEDGAVSAVFVIADKPYEELQQGLLKAFYYFRCGIELAGDYAGPWGHAACHLAEGTVHGHPGVKLDGCGGWHDAGEYGKALIHQ